MPQRITLKSITIFIIFLVFAYSLYPTIQWNSMTKEEQNNLKVENPLKHRKLSKEAIKLGLDLQGGIHVNLEVDLEALLRELATNKDDRFRTALEAAAREAQENNADIVSVLDDKLQDMGVDIVLYYSTRDIRTREEVLDFLQAQKSESIERALEVLRNRVDEFGVSEPIIQKQGGSRIIVELAGITDRQTAVNLIGQTAHLQFSLLKDADVAISTAQQINNYLSGQNQNSDSLTEAIESQDTPQDTSGQEAEDLFATTQNDSDEIFASKETEDIFIVTPGGVIYIKAKNEAKFKELMEEEEIKRIIQSEARDAVFRLKYLDTNTNDGTPEGEKSIEVFLINATAGVDGKTIIDAGFQPSDRSDPQNFGKYETSITFNDEGTRAFSTLTGANEGKRLAIVLDNKVRTAPNIQQKIRFGRARITGLATNDEAKVLASVLKAGSLPTPLKIIEERTVGASLGKDSIDKGYYSTLVGLFLVSLFMVFYYKFSGMVANIALVLNIFILLGAMASFKATLTMPGIAGIILTIGMAVDANVLIFERIREEIDKGKSTWAALDTGFARAVITILDANITTLIAAIVLYNFGTGPIRGFAVTLMIGIIASMFTAIFVTRTIFEFLLSKKILKQISI